MIAKQKADAEAEDDDEDYDDDDDDDEDVEIDNVLDSGLAIDEVRFSAIRHTPCERRPVPVVSLPPPPDPDRRETTRERLRSRRACPFATAAAARESERGTCAIHPRAAR